MSGSLAIDEVLPNIAFEADAATRRQRFAVLFAAGAAQLKR
jgi:hypothetical protein